MVTETQLANAIFAAQDALGPVVEFTVVFDDRAMPPSLGYLVEVQDEVGAILFVCLSTALG